MPPDSCPPYLNAPECMPPLTEHEALVWAMVWGVGMGFVLGKIDWTVLGSLFSVFRKNLLTTHGKPGRGKGHKGFAKGTKQNQS